MILYNDVAYVKCEFHLIVPFYVLIFGWFALRNVLITVRKCARYRTSPRCLFVGAVGMMTALKRMDITDAFTDWRASTRRCQLISETAQRRQLPMTRPASRTIRTALSSVRLARSSTTARTYLERVSGALTVAFP